MLTNTLREVSKKAEGKYLGKLTNLLKNHHRNVSKADSSFHAIFEDVMFNAMHSSSLMFQAVNKNALETI